MGDIPNTACLSNQEVFHTCFFLLWLAFTIFAWSVLLGHAGSGIPRNHLGRRPMGKGLFSYLFHHITTGVGVKGYDSSLGSFSPPVRMLFHFGFLVTFYALGLAAWDMLTSLDSFQLFKICIRSDQSTNHSGWNAFDAPFNSYYFLIFVTVYLSTWGVYTKFSKGVSHPGGPRAQKIRRSPKWESKLTQHDMKSVSSIQWKCDVSHRSHAITNEKFHVDELLNGKSRKQVFAAVNASEVGKKGDPILLGLSGEPDGRQIWSWTNLSNEEKVESEVNEDFVLEMALGGRKRGFNPQDNPNRYVKILFHCLPVLLLHMD